MIFMFDIGQTLLDNERPPVDDIMAQIEIPLDKRDVLKKLLFTTDYETDITKLIRNIEFRCDKPFTDIERDSFLKIIQHQEHSSFPMEGSKAFVRKITDNKAIEYCIVSNIWRPFYNAFKHHFPRFNNGAYKHFLSHLMGSRKPYKNFYDHIFANLPVGPEHTIMIGDRMGNDIKPCLKMGGKAIWFNHQKLEYNFKHERLYVVESYDEMYETILNLRHGDKG